jgi:hypothetical protein
MTEAKTTATKPTPKPKSAEARFKNIKGTRIWTKSHMLFAGEEITLPRAEGEAHPYLEEV